jgi:flagellar biosynthesis/type III secretory pathway chaperone
MMPADLRSDFDTLLARMAQAAAQLAGVLAQERSALRDLDVAALDATSQVKQRCLAVLEECERERVRCCDRAGESSHPRDMHALLARLDEGGALAQRWSQLTTALLACRSDNRAIGVLLGMSKRRVAETLALLLGDAQDRAAYGPDGRAHAGNARAPIASA